MIGFALFAAWATLGLQSADHYWAGRPSACAHTYVAAIVSGGSPEGGNFRDESGNCYVWINTDDSPYTGPDVCKIIVHEVGHLRGLQHSPDPRSVMYSPYHSSPMPSRCRHLPRRTRTP